VIQSLSYIGFASPNTAAWPDFATSILGAEVAEPGVDGTVRLRVDDAAARIYVHPGERNDLAYLGWAVAGPAPLEEAVRNAERHGFAVHRGDADLAKRRAVAEVVWFTDPFGFRHEMSWGLTARPGTFKPSRPMSGFVTGAGGLGHVVLMVPDVARAERFVLDVLGFRLSDRVENIKARFFHCNSRHHTLAFAPVPGAVGMHHLMLEVNSLDDVGTALDRCIERKLPLAMELGHHTNDRMTSFYVRSPSGFEIEYGWGGLLVDDADWVVRSYDSGSVWGHRRPDNAPPPGIIRPFQPAAT
jgi:2,3-dihydroxybiphenyl 1,2-dioxygenase